MTKRIINLNHPTAPLQVTRQKHYKKGTCSLTPISMDELAEQLTQGGEHSKQVTELRRQLPHWRGIGVDWTSGMNVEHIHPSAIIRQRSGVWLLRSYTGVVMLKVENVFTTEEKAAVRKAATALPMTLMVFEGASGMSMYVLVRVKATREYVGKTVEETEAFHRTAFRQVSALYNSLLPKKVDRTKGSRLTDHFMLSVDPKCFYRREAVPFEVNPAIELPAVQEEPQDKRLEELLLPVPTLTDYREFYDERWEMAMQEAVKRQKEAGLLRSPEGERALLPFLVEVCYELQFPLPETRARLLMELPINEEELTAYVNGYYEQRDPSALPGRKAAQDVVGMERWLQKNYEFQRNSITGDCLYRPRTTDGEWKLVSSKEQATFTLEAMKVGLRVNRGNIRDYINSRLIPEHDPVKDYLDNAEEAGWDGRDRIEALATCVPTTYEVWPRLFHVWFCATVFQMQGGDGMHGNALMPLLIGDQAANKSNFCRALLPPELRWGALEKVDLTEDTKVLRLLARTLIINLDEFNQISARQQTGALKNLLQLPDVRVSTNGVLQALPRRASFIGTCNPAEVLADETGSRRYICVKLLTGKRIELPVDLDYTQLYAQAVHELRQREVHPEAFAPEDPRGRTFLTPEEERELTEHNRSYESPRMAVELFDSLFEPLTERKDYKVKNSTVEMTRAEIILHLEKASHQHYPDYEKRALRLHLDQLVDSGRLLRYHSRKGTAYHLRPLRSFL